MVFKRAQKLSTKNSCFLFGARGTGKTTLLKNLFSKKKEKTLWINLLSFKEEERLSHNPDLLSELLSDSPYTRVVIDEIQKVPRLLDIVHLEIEKNKKIQFILTGSSSRKLKKEGVNLLAGRLFTFTLHPLTYKELGSQFHLGRVLQMGSLPSVFHYDSLKEKSRYLNSYVRTYLREEIIFEQLIRNIQPFRNFLNLVAQMNGQIINYSKLSKDIRVDYTSIKNYFDILSDTYLGFYLNGFTRSFRKQIHKAPKFYLFDCGVGRALSGKAHIPLVPKSYEYELAFEHFIITELFRLNAYYESQFAFSYLRDKNGNEIDIIIKKPEGREILVEIKSSQVTQKEDGKVLKKYLHLWDSSSVEAQVWSNDLKNRKINNVFHYHWKTGLQKLFS